jgi:protein-S-isoprenylcysteine O-methyltransferase Ste14
MSSVYSQMIILCMIVLAGVALAIWARRILGANWSAAVTIKKGHQLIRSGPYALVRNPIYSGDILIVLGMALAVGKTRGLLGLVVMVAAVWHKGRTEERFLLTEFGDQYSDYQRAVGFLLPRLRSLSPGRAS